MIKVTDLLNEVERIARENPDETYNRRCQKIIGREIGHCRYAINGEAACIIGVALDNLGVPMPVIEMFDRRTSSTIRHIIKEHPQIFEVDDLNALHRIDAAQDAQDNGLTWGSIFYT